MLCDKVKKGKGRGMIVKTPAKLFEANREWADKQRAADPDFFKRLAALQAPEYLWIGCSDARVPANQITGLAPGEVFVHRNVANLVYHIDANLLSVLEFAINALKVKHIIVCGHYGCGGVRAALGRTELGLIDNWLRQIKDTYAANAEALERETDLERKVNMLCELNVRQQVKNICHTTIVQNAWQAGQPLSVHGWIYSLDDGLLHDLGIWADGMSDIGPIYRMQTIEPTPGF
jgi:carbonic anhydrase